MQFTIDYLTLFFTTLKLVSPLLVFAALLITLMGWIVGSREFWGRFDSIYWAFITATTVGYGDIRPLKKLSKVLSVFIALVGMTFTGILVAVAIYAASTAIDKQEEIAEYKACIEAID